MSYKILPGGVIATPGNSRQNKTGQWSTKRPVIDKKKCIKCHQCTIYCPENCIMIKDDKSVLVNESFCKGCSVCVSICPVRAIKMEKK